MDWHKEPMSKMISNSGDVLNITGYAIDGGSIFGDDGKEYPAAVGSNDNLIWATIEVQIDKDTSYVVACDMEDTFIKIHASQVYKGENKFETC
jgi:hypothetical protein